MSNRPKNPANARNKNVLIIGGSGSGKTRFWLKPNLLQMHSSYVVTDPKGYTEKADAGEILLAACKDTKSADPVPLGSYRGFQMELSFDSFRNEFDVTLKGAVSHRVALGTDARGNITRLDNALAGIPERLERANEQLNNLYNQQEAAKAEVGKPFPQEAELTAKSQRLAELDAALNMEDSAENRDERSEPERPSVLADLKSKAEHIPPAKYSETREEVL